MFNTSPWLACLFRLATVLACAMLVACATNPVTGESQLMLSSTNEDITIGRQQYEPAQQSQGGQYVVDPQLTTYVSRVGQKLAAVSDTPNLPYEFVVLNNSVPNAWALPGGKIAINRGLLLALENEAQLAAVLGHEVVHAAARHGAQRMRDNMLVQIGLAGIGMGLADNDYRQLIIGGAALGAQLITAKYGREHELESDRYGMEYMVKAGYNPMGAVELQRVFVQLAQGRKSSWLEGLFASHPPSQERVEQNLATAQALGGNTGKTGQDDYQQAIAYLASKKKAYDLADQAAAAIQQGNHAKATELLNEAIAIEEREALFHSLKGKALEQQGQSKAALASHSRATELNPNQFSYYLHRAESYQSLGLNEEAERDLTRSMKLLPTSVAALQLGQLAETGGERAQAAQYYQEAARAPGNIGQQATVKLARLDIQSRPQRYIEVEHFQDPKGPLLVRINNRSPLKVTEVKLLSTVFNEQGQRVSEDAWIIDDPLEAGEQSRFYPIKSVYHLPAGQQVRTRVTGVTSE